MRFFLVDGLYPALEASDGSMSILKSDNSWGSVEPAAVLRDERSPEVSEAEFTDRASLFGGKVPALS